jgi:hypothetical protein
MEKDLKRIKSQMLNDELSGFEFTGEMSRQVLKKLEKKHGRKHQIFKPLIPITVTAAFLIISSVGIYRIAIQDQPNQQSEGPLAQPPADKEEEKPVLVFPGYIPEGYKFKHTKTNDEIYEHVYVKKNTDDSFSYRMQKTPQAYQEGTEKNIPLTPELQGTIIPYSDSGTALTWVNDGYFHILEQRGAMEEIDFLKIADSILAKQGIQSYLGDEIEKLETEAKEQERTEEPGDLITQTDEEETDKENPVDEVPALTEEKALDILKRFEEIKNNVYSASDDLRIQGFSTKDQFYEAFSEVMTRKEAEWKFSYRIQEKENGLYIIPMDGLQSWVFKVPHDEFTKIDEKKYTISQYLKDDLNGHGPFPVTFEYMNGQWLITSYGRDYK